MAVNLARLKFSAGILISMLLFQMSVALIRSRRNSDAEEVRIRQEQLRSWNCGTPKPRLVYLLDEHKNLETTSIVWSPNAAILHRCEAALGLCQNYPSKTCQPRITVNVAIVFQKLNVQTGESEYLRLDFKNHTACSCAAAPSATCT